MAQTNKAASGATPHQPAPLRLSRVFHAPRETVFQAWSSADHVKRWFSPETYTVSHANVEARAGGAFEVCMRSPTGQEHWTRGKFVDFTPHTKLVIDADVTDSAGKMLFRAFTEVAFSDALGGTQIDVVQTYQFIDPSMAAPMVAGAPEGWRTTLDKLEKEVVRMRGERTPACGRWSTPRSTSKTHLRLADRTGLEFTDRRNSEAEVVQWPTRQMGIARAAHGCTHGWPRAAQGALGGRRSVDL